MMQIIYWSGLSFLTWLLMSFIAPLSMRPSKWHSFRTNKSIIISYALIMFGFGLVWGGLMMGSIGLHAGVAAYVFLNAFVFAFVAGRFDDNSESHALWRIFASTFVLYIGFFAATSTHIGQWEKITTLTEVEVIDKPLFAEADESEMRVMPKAVAAEVAKKVLGKRTSEGHQMGAMYGIDEETMTLQYIGETQFWVVPLAHKSFFKELRAGEVYGYVKVKANVADYEPELVESPMVYTPSSTFSHNLKRLVVSKYPTRPKMERKFMINDKGKPVFIQFFGKWAVGLSNLDYDGGVIIDPVTGDMEEFEHGKAPSWMDYGISEAILLERLNSWGEYRNGFGEGFIGSQSLMLPTSVNGKQSIFFVDAVGTSNGKAFFTGLSNKSGNNALAAMVYADPMTGKVKIYYPDSTASPDEDSIIKQVNAALGINATRWSPTEPIPYRVYDTLDVWLTPIVSAENVIVGYAFSDVNTPNKTVWDADLSVALNKLLSLGVNSGSVSNLNNADAHSGSIRSVVIQDTYAYFTIIGEEGSVYPRLFACDVTLAGNMPECLALVVGDHIEFEAHERGDKRSTVAKIHNSIFEQAVIQ